MNHHRRSRKRADLLWTEQMVMDVLNRMLKTDFPLAQYPEAQKMIASVAFLSFRAHLELCLECPRAHCAEGMALLLRAKEAYKP